MRLPDAQTHTSLYVVGQRRDVLSRQALQHLVGQREHRRAVSRPAIGRHVVGSASQWITQPRIESRPIKIEHHITEPVSPELVETGRHTIFHRSKNANDLRCWSMIIFSVFS